MFSIVVVLVALLCIVGLLGFLADHTAAPTATRGDDGSTGPDHALVEFRWHRAEQLRRRVHGVRADRTWAERVGDQATRRASFAVVGGSVATLAFLWAPLRPMPVPAAIGALAGTTPAANLLWVVPVVTALIAFNGFRLRHGADRGVGWCRAINASVGACCLALLLPLLTALALAVLTPGSATVAAGFRPALGALQVGYGLVVLGLVLALVGHRQVADRLRAAEHR